MLSSAGYRRPRRAMRRFVRRSFWRTGLALPPDKPDSRPSIRWARAWPRTGAWERDACMARERAIRNRSIIADDGERPDAPAPPCALSLTKLAIRLFKSWARPCPPVADREYVDGPAPLRAPTGERRL